MTSTNTLINFLNRFLGLAGILVLVGVGLFWFSVRDQLVAQGNVYELPFTYDYVPPTGSIVGEYLELRGEFHGLRLESGHYVLDLKPFNAPQRVDLVLPSQFNPDFVTVSKNKIVADDQPFTPQNLGTGTSAFRFLLNYQQSSPTYVNVVIIKPTTGDDLISELTVTIDE